MSRSGAQLFARYAYPPNELGYCGPGDASVLLRRDGGAEHEIAQHARQFEGAWVYLELIAAAAGIDDPLDARVVEAYWIGNELLERMDDTETARLVQERIPPQSGASWGPGPAHHGYQVFAVYPWSGLLRQADGNANAQATALHVLDRCRIRWGTVVSSAPADVTVLCRPLEWRDGALQLGPAVEQTAAVAIEGRSLLATPDGVVPGVAEGDVVAMHWGWVCDVLTASQAEHLRRHTEEQIARVSLPAARPSR